MFRATATPDEAHAGRQLRELRKSSGLSQARLAKLAGVGCHTVSRWENKKRFHRRSRSLKCILEVLEPLRRNCAGLTRARVDGVLLGRGVLADVVFPARNSRKKAHESQIATRNRVRCGAKTRKGTPCRLMSEPGRRRCKFHGGKSTGPKTPEGKERISLAQRLRWMKYRQSL